MWMKKGQNETNYNGVFLPNSCVMILSGYSKIQFFYPKFRIYKFMRNASFVLLLLIFLAACSDEPQLTLDQAPADLKLTEEMKLKSQLARSGDLDAMFELGAYYAEASEYGDTRDKNPHAMFWLTYAAQQGHAWALNEMGTTYKDGRFGEKKDYKKAIIWFQKAAKAGDYMAYYNLGRMYRDGIGVKRDLVKSFDHMKASADMGYGDSMFDVSLAYEQGLGVTASPELSNIYFAKAKAANISLGEFMRREFFYDSDKLMTKEVVLAILASATDGLPKNRPIGDVLIWFSDELYNNIDLKEAASDFYLHDINKQPDKYVVENGTVTTKELATELSDALSLYIDEDKNFISFELARVAALLGSRKAMVRLSDYYAKGKGVKKNETEATYWLNRSRSRGAN